MDKILKGRLNRLKVQIKSDYLAGEYVEDIAQRLGVTRRTVYHHLQPLSPEDKSVHAKNAALRAQVKKQEEKLNDQPVSQPTKEPAESLSGASSYPNEPLREDDPIADYIKQGVDRS